MSQLDFEVTNSDLSAIQSLAQRIGYPEAIRRHLKLPVFDVHFIKERAHWHYVNGPSSFCDPYLIERSWIKAVGEILEQSGHPIWFRFEIDLYTRSGADLPKEPDNPT